MMIGERIKCYRVERNMTQEQLAESSELSPNYICQIEKSKKQAGMGALERIANALKVSVVQLIREINTSEITTYTGALIDEVSDCEAWEAAIIWDVVRNLKQSLRANRQ